MDGIRNLEETPRASFLRVFLVEPSANQHARGHRRERRRQRQQKKWVSTIRNTRILCLDTHIR